MDYEKYFAAYDAAHTTAAATATQTPLLNVLVESGIGGILFSLSITFMILYSLVSSK